MTDEEIKMNWLAICESGARMTAIHNLREHYKQLEKENAELNRDKTELVNSVTELKSKVTELEKEKEDLFFNYVLCSTKSMKCNFCTKFNGKRCPKECPSDTELFENYKKGLK